MNAIDMGVLLGLLPDFGTAALRTLALLAAAVAGGLLIGFIANLARELGPPLFARLYWVYTAVWRGVPFLVHLFIVYFGLPSAGLALSPFQAAALTLAVYSGAYFAEIFRACWRAIPAGQIEAARAAGLSRRQVFAVIQCPQALRAAVPLIANQAILVLKESALASVITYPELTMTAGRIVAVQFTYVEPYLLLALCYWLLAAAIARAGRLLARRTAIDAMVKK